MNYKITYVIYFQCMNKIFKLCKSLIETNASPSSIALGFATGTLIAILPTPGFGIFIALFLAIIFKKINKIGIIAAFSVWNPLILVPTYWLCYLLGDSVFTPDPGLHFHYELANQIYHHSGKFLVGNFFIATFTAFISYYIVFHLISLRKEKVTFKNVSKFYSFSQIYKIK